MLSALKLLTYLLLALSTEANACDNTEHCGPQATEFGTWPRYDSNGRSITKHIKQSKSNYIAPYELA